MKRMNKYLLILMILSALILNSRCGRDTNAPATGTEDKQEILKTARIISHVTSGMIAPSDAITVTFVNPEIETADVDGTVNVPVFVFKPVIDGTTRWLDRRTLVFTPNRPLPFRNTFAAEFHFNKLFPKYKENKPLTFSFTTSGRELAAVEGDFQLHEPNKPEVLHYTGTITFTQPVDPEAVKNAVTLKGDNGPIALQWKPEKDTELSFQSEKILRDGKRKRFILTVEKEAVDISQSFEKTILLEPLNDLSVSEIILFNQGEGMGLEIVFTDPPDPAQDLNGLINVDPKIPFVFKRVDKRVLLSGEFESGKQYTVHVSGVRSKWGTTMTTPAAHRITFQDRKPQISFLQDGLFLPSANRKKLGFKTLNVKQVSLSVKKVFESNLGQFLQGQTLNAGKQRNDRFYDYDIERVGITVFEKKINTGTEKNRWINHFLDMSNLIKPGEKGIFLFTLEFTRDDMLYDGLDTKTKYYYGNDYYSNPNSSGYLYRQGTIVKPVILSDIGLTYKHGHDEHLVFATHLETADPMRGVSVTLRTFQNQVAAKGITDANGCVRFDDVKETIFYVEAETDGQRSMIKPAEMGWNLSTFDTGGVVVKKEATQAYIYSERGVYRPGDPIHLSIIARNNDNTFPDGHPVTVKLYNPRNQLAGQQTSAKGKDGFYCFTLNTGPDDPTGNWKARIMVGSLTFYHPLKVETVVPNRLKVNIKSDKTLLTPADRAISFDLISNYLFGAPAAGLNAEVNISIRHRPKTFAGYPGFSFTNEAVSFSAVSADVYKKALDPQGRARISWDLPSLRHLPSAADAVITAQVYEKGGRFTRNEQRVAIDNHENYVGLEKLKFRYGYSRVGDPLKVSALLVNRDGQPVPGRQLTYKIYKNSEYWWWEYRSISDFRLRFKKDKSTQLVTQGEVLSRSLPGAITFKPMDTGEYLLEVGDAGGHTAGFFFSAYYWGDAPAGVESAGTITLKSDRPSYAPGDNAEISFPQPESGVIFVTIEKAHRILHSYVYRCTPAADGSTGANGENERRIKIPVTHEMLPNVYVSVSIIQPHAQTLNDRPLRVYGVLPLAVEDTHTRQGLSIQMPDTLQSDQPFTVTLQTKDRKPTQLTVAVVDEGLLDLTNHVSPDAWREFFKKQKLAISTFDLFAYVIGAHKGDLSRLISIGGDMDGDGYRKSQQEPGKLQRFKPVSLFRGPVATDENGKAVLSFDMPDYIGSVRVMAVSAVGNRYGNAEKTVPVKTDLMVLPTLPRVMGPGDRIVLPVTVFALQENIKNVKLSVSVTGALKLHDEAAQTLTFDKPGEKDASFTLSALPEVGPASVTVTAVSGKMKAEKRTDLNIRPYSARIYATEIKPCAPDQTVTFILPDRGVKGTNRAVVQVMRKPKLNIDHRLGWLLHYPYGCIEQTVSAVFPQLYLKGFLKSAGSIVRGSDDAARIKEIDNNIQEGIQRLRRFQLPNGGFAYWPGNKDVSHWGTNYAVHFLLEAKALGYNVPADLLDNALQYQANLPDAGPEHILTTAYRLYGLAKGDKAPLGPMNLLKENHAAKMTDTEKWLLAAAYKMVGNETVAEAMIKTTGFKVEEYQNGMGGTYGSRLRDQAIMLEVLTLFKKWPEAEPVYDAIAEALAGDYWYSTQSLGYALMAAGKYMAANTGQFGDQNTVLSGYVQLPGKNKVSFSTTDLRFSIPVDDGFGKEVSVHLDKKTTIQQAYAAVEWNGVPLVPDVAEVSSNLWVTVDWLNDSGIRIDPRDIKQGENFWAYYRVGAKTNLNRRLEELALVQVLPSGWEIENTRLTGAPLPDWMRKWNLNKEEYVDIRDDRIMWFFDLPHDGAVYEFVVKLNAVTAGQFILPPTVFEAMYDHRYKAVKKGGFVRVQEPEER